MCVCVYKHAYLLYISGLACSFKYSSTYVCISLQWVRQQTYRRPVLSNHQHQCQILTMLWCPRVHVPIALRRLTIPIGAESVITMSTFTGWNVKWYVCCMYVRCDGVCCKDIHTHAYVHTCTHTHTHTPVHKNNIDFVVVRKYILYFSHSVGWLVTRNVSSFSWSSVATK